MTCFRALCFAILWLATHLALAWWSHDLPMNNTESLFMTRGAAADYHLFRELVGERRVLAVKIELDHDMSELEFIRIKDGIRTLKDLYPEPDFQWLDFHSAYQKKLASGNFAETRSFWTTEKDLLLPLFSDRHGGFVVMIDWNVSDAKITELTSYIQKSSSFRMGHVAIAGLPWVNLKLNQYAGDIKTILMPLMFLVCFGFTWLLLRSLPATVLLILASIFALSSSMALIKALYGSLNMITAVVPLRVFVVNLTLCFYVYFSAIQRGSLRLAITAKWRPIAMGLAATALGFGSNAVSSIPAIRQVAIVAMIALIMAGFSSVFILWMIDPLWQRFLTLPKTLLHNPRVCFPFPTWSPRVKNSLLIGVIACVAVSASQIPILTDATQYFPPKSGIKADLDRVENGFLGTPVFEVVLKKSDNTEFNFDDYTTLASAELSLTTQLGAPYKILSLNALAREANRLFSGVDTIPANKFAWMTLMGGLPEQVRASFPTGRAYRVSLLGKALNHDSFLHDQSIVWSELAKLPPAYRFEVSGLNFNLMQSQEDLLQILLLSFFGSVAVILVAFQLFFQDFKATLRFALWTLAPMGLGICLMFLLRFSLNIATVMSFGVSLGMIVSGLIHIAYENCHSNDAEKLHYETILPLAAAAVVLTIGFGLFGLNEFLPIHQEGILVAAMIAVGGITAIATRHQS